MSGLVATRVTPLEEWIAGKICRAGKPLTREALAAYQLARVNETLAWVRERSRFYGRHLVAWGNSPLRSLDEMAALPFTTAEDVIAEPGRFLCVSQDEIRRVATLFTSGTGGAPKRVFFTETDLELALDYFAHGVSAVAESGEAMVIALPSERDRNVGAQLAAGILRAGVDPVPAGTIDDPAALLALVEEHHAAAIIGLPVAMHRLALLAGRQSSAAFRNLRSIVLCSDHVPSSLVRSLRQQTAAQVFEHYGSTEMGLGGGIDCEAHAGYHMREADFLVEIVDPVTGAPLPDGAEGEVVFTTLTRRGMPLIRYRSGDISRWIDDPCPCGSVLRRMARIRCRVDSGAALASGDVLTQSMLDEALFAVAGLEDFLAAFTPGVPGHLAIKALVTGTARRSAEDAVLRALHSVSHVASALRRGALTLSVQVVDGPLSAPGAKRRIRVEPSA
jgi:phenylacetate-CoA ligase